MSVGFDPSAAVPTPVAFPVHRFTVEEYRRLADTGVLSEDNRVELLEGVISPKIVHKPPDDATVELLDEAIRRRLPPGWRIRIQSAITTEDSEPEPDLAVVRGSARQRTTHHPGPKDIGLLVEVADSSLIRDRDKRRIYARAEIALYWIVNLVDGCIEVYSQPVDSAGGPAYAAATSYSSGDILPLVLDGVELDTIPVSEMLP